MFERYTEPARRVIFYSRYMAVQTGSPEIETEHLLLGLLRAVMVLAQRFLGSPWAAEQIWQEVEHKKSGSSSNSSRNFSRTRGRSSGRDTKTPG